MASWELTAGGTYRPVEGPSWDDHGMPAGVAIGRDQPWRSGSAITFVKAGTRQIFVFVIGENQRLYEHSWNGSIWKWADHGKPSDTPELAYGTPIALTFLDAERHIYVFVTTN